MLRLLFIEKAWLALNIFDVSLSGFVTFAGPKICDALSVKVLKNHLKNI